MSTSRPEPADLLTLADAAAREAGAMVRDRRAAAEQIFVASTKSTPTDVVTESDTAAEALIRDRLLAARPRDAILGEEGGSSTGTTDVVWVIDPIDGTVNYLYGIPHYAVSIAAQVGGTVVAGVVHDPVSGETWSAVRGGGARLDGQEIRHSGCNRLDRALVGTGFGYAPERRAAQARVLLDLLPAVRDIRRAGAASLDLCAVASGRLDAYYERGLQPWDIAAGGLIAAEAGAVVTGLTGRPASGDLAVAAAPDVAEALLDLLHRVGADRD
jgi:myo-inositol-1(or 4)-monophosphatase